MTKNPGTMNISEKPAHLFPGFLKNEVEEFKRQPLFNPFFQWKVEEVETLGSVRSLSSGKVEQVERLKM